MSSTAEAASILKPGFDALNVCRGFTTSLADAIPEDKLTFRACPDSNHTAFILGHTAKTDDFMLTALAGQASALPESWGKLFDGGAEILDDAGAYPSKQELLDAMAERREVMIGWLSTLSPEQLSEPVEGDLAQFIPTRAALPASTAFHEGFHAGQLSTIRRALGIPRLF